MLQLIKSKVEGIETYLSPRSVGIIYVSIGMSCFGFIGLFANLLKANGVSVNGMIHIRCLVSWMVLY